MDNLCSVLYPGKVELFCLLEAAFYITGTTPTQTHHIQSGNTCFRGDTYLVEQGVRVSVVRVK